MSQKQFPQEFIGRLEKIIPRPLLLTASEMFSAEPCKTVRVNAIKASVVDIIHDLSQQGIRARTFGAVPEALDVGEDGLSFLKQNHFFEKGIVYQQSLSSMLAVKILDPRAGERILDLCAAPGSKTSQIAARMNNEGTVCAVEPVRGRFYKLKSVLNMLGIVNTACICIDGRKFRAKDDLFDRVLVDAPCSSEGRFKIKEPETYQYWSLRKIREMVRKQRGLLLNAGRLVKERGVLVYSTCTFAPEENEGVIDWFLKKTENAFAVEEISPGDDIRTYPAVMSWGKKTFNPQIEKCVRVLPAEMTEGFFIAKMRKQSCC
ncbi:MAG: RsmB/NOP family class I SAM-dependent RNA methyltransferase [Candidatus Omnitrophota bacterium]